MYYIGSMTCNPDYLAHHGIQGQKWGVRRYQNPDGTLTAAGKERYGVGSKYFAKAESKFYKAQKFNIDMSEKSARKHTEKAARTKNEKKRAAHEEKARIASENAERARKRIDTYERMSDDEKSRAMRDSNLANLKRNPWIKPNKASRASWNIAGTAALMTWIPGLGPAAHMAFRAISDVAATVGVHADVTQAIIRRSNPYQNFGSEVLDAKISELNKKG